VSSLLWFPALSGVILSVSLLLRGLLCLLVLLPFVGRVCYFLVESLNDEENSSSSSSVIWVPRRAEGPRRPVHIKIPKSPPPQTSPACPRSAPRLSPGRSPKTTCGPAGRPKCRLGQFGPACWGWFGPPLKPGTIVQPATSLGNNRVKWSNSAPKKAKKTEQAFI
jgi:hypothetical protein